jgi:hypothetical protein
MVRVRTTALVAALLLPFLPPRWRAPATTALCALAGSAFSSPQRTLRFAVLLLLLAPFGSS